MSQKETVTKEILEDDPGITPRRSSRIATRRPSASTEEATATPAKVTRARRVSASQESVDSTDDIISSSQSSSPKAKRSTRSPSRSVKASDEIKTASRTTRSKGSVSEDIKNEDQASASVTTRRRSLRATSSSPTSDSNITSKGNTPRKSLRAASASPTREVNKSTPVRRGRKGSVTERLVPLEAIEETDTKIESVENTKDKDKNDVNENNDEVVFKKKKALLGKKLNLQPISEKSFNEETRVDEQGEGNLSKEKISVQNKDENNVEKEKTSPELNTSENKPKRLSLSLLKAGDTSSDELIEEKELKVVLCSLPEKEILKKTPQKTNVSECDKTKSPKISTKDCVVNLNVSDASDSSNKENQEQNEATTAISEKSQTPQILINRISDADMGEPMEVDEFPKGYDHSGNSSNNKTETPNKKLNESSEGKKDTPKKASDDAMGIKEPLSDEENLNKRDTSITKNITPPAPEKIQKKVEEARRLADRTPEDMEKGSPRRSPRLSKNNENTTKSISKEVVVSLGSRLDTSKESEHDRSKTELESRGEEKDLDGSTSEEFSIGIDESDDESTSKSNKKLNVSNTKRSEVENSENEKEGSKGLQKEGVVEESLNEADEKDDSSDEIIDDGDVESNGKEENLNKSVQRKSLNSSLKDKTDLQKESSDSSKQISKEAENKKIEKSSKEGDNIEKSKNESLRDSNEERVEPTVNLHNEVDDELDTTKTIKRHSKRHSKKQISNSLEDDSEDLEKPKSPEEITTNKNGTETKKSNDNPDESDSDVESLEKSNDKETDLETKIDSLIQKKIEDDSSSDHSKDSPIHFLDDMAEEGEEDTPSEGSNDIVDVGESIGSSETEQSGSDDTYDGNDPFIDDNDYNDLLSGEEFDLTQEKTAKEPENKNKKRRSRIIEITDSEDENSEALMKKTDQASVAIKTVEINEAKKKLEKLKDQIDEDSDLDKMSTRPYCGLTPPSAVSVRDSLSDSEKIEIKSDENSADVVINKQDNLESLEELKQHDVDIPELKDSQTETKRLSNSHIAEKGNSSVFTPNNSLLMADQTPQSEKARKRQSSITIQENIKLKDIEEGKVCDRIVKVIDVFCNSVKGEQNDTSGNISLNISVEYLNSPAKPTSEEGNLHELKRNLTSELTQKLNKEVTENVEDKLEQIVENSQFGSVADASPKPILKEVEKSPLEGFTEKSPKRKRKHSEKREGSQSTNELCEPQEPVLRPQSAKSKRKKSYSENNQLSFTSESQSENEKRKSKKQKQAEVDINISTGNDSDLSGDLDEELHEKYLASFQDIVQSEDGNNEKPKKKKKSKKLKITENLENAFQKDKTDETMKKATKLKRKATTSTDQEEDEVDEELHEKYLASFQDIVQSEDGDNENTKKKKKSKKLKITENLENAFQKDNTDETMKKTKKLKRKATTSTDQEEDEVNQELEKVKVAINHKKSNVNNIEKTDDFEVTTEKYKPKKSSQIPKPKFLPSSIFGTVSKHLEKKTSRKPKTLPTTTTETTPFWNITTVESPLLPSTNNIKRIISSSVPSFHVKDFKNQMLYDSSRIPRVDTKVMLQKKQKVRY